MQQFDAAELPEWDWEGSRARSGESLTLSFMKSSFAHYTTSGKPIIIPAPNHEAEDDYAVDSPDGRWIVSSLTIASRPPWWRLVHRMFPRFHSSIRRDAGLWLSHIDGTDLHEIGHVSADANPSISTLQNLTWLPGGKDVSFVYKDAVWVVPAR